MVLRMLTGSGPIRCWTPHEGSRLDMCAKDFKPGSYLLGLIPCDSNIRDDYFSEHMQISKEIDGESSA
jgi:hypothetical protein